MNEFKTEVRQDNRFVTMFMNTLTFSLILAFVKYVLEKPKSLEEYLFVGLLMGLPSAVFIVLFLRKWKREPSFVSFQQDQLIVSGTLNLIKRKIALSQIISLQEEPYHFYYFRGSSLIGLNYSCIRLALADGKSILLISYKFRNYRELKKMIRKEWKSLENPERRSS